MEPIHILALEATKNIGPKTIEKALAASASFEPANPADLINILKKQGKNTAGYPCQTSKM